MSKVDQAKVDRYFAIAKELNRGDMNFYGVLLGYYDSEDTTEISLSLCDDPKVYKVTVHTFENGNLIDLFTQHYSKEDIAYFDFFGFVQEHNMRVEFLLEKDD